MVEQNGALYIFMIIVPLPPTLEWFRARRKKPNGRTDGRRKKKKNRNLGKRKDYQKGKNGSYIYSFLPSFLLSFFFFKKKRKKNKNKCGRRDVPLLPGIFSSSYYKGGDEKGKRRVDLIILIARFGQLAVMVSFYLRLSPLSPPKEYYYYYISNSRK